MARLYSLRERPVHLGPLPAEREVPLVWLPCQALQGEPEGWPSTQMQV